MQLRKNRKAQGLVEFALLLPVLLLIILGIMEFGRILIIYTGITNAVKEGARYGIVVQNESEIRTAVARKILLVPPGDVSISLACDSGPGSTEFPVSDANCYVGGRVIVRADYSIQAMTAFIQPLLGGGINISPDGIRTIASARPSGGPAAPTVTPDGSGLSEAEITATAQAAEATGTAQAVDLTATSAALSVTPTDTPSPDATETNTPTETPIVLAPIIIDDPVTAGETFVTGTAEPNQSVTLRIIQTGLVRTITVDGSGNFQFTGLPALIGGHTVLVQGYGEQDLEVVEGVETATPTLTATPTATSTPEVTENAITADANCSTAQSISLTVTGTGWPSTSSNVKIIRFMLYLESGPAIQIDEISFGGGGGFTHVLDITDLPDGNHHVQAFGVKNGSLVPGYESNLLALDKPCPLTPPDLVVSGIEIQNTPPYGTNEQFNVTVGISNIGGRDVSTMHWVDLYVDPAGDDLMQEISVDYVALNALGGGTTISFTMYVVEGFATLGEHTLQVKVDTWDQIPESDETNNVSTLLTVDVTTWVPPEPTATPEIITGERGSIEGITLLNGNPQEYTAVYVYDSDGRIWGSGRSDENGEYSIDELPAGEYLVVGQLRLADLLYVGDISVTVNAGLTEVGVDINLTPIGSGG
ncbi:MAG: CARDB domain-containing protein [Anaerolineae bacterium]|nr:CARDB domain-containing protein [Anaerolineae bacterium]